MQSVFSERSAVLLALMLSAIALFVTTLGAEYQALGAVQSPVYFPRIILGLWIGLTVIALVQEMMKTSTVEPVEKWGTLILFVVIALVYANAVTRVGFMLSSVPFAAISLMVFGMRTPWVVAVYAVVVPGALVVLFNHILKLPLPTSPFTYLF